MTHHKTWFPVIVVALTALLGVFIYSIFREQFRAAPTTPVTAVEYQTNVHGQVGGLRTALAAAASNDERVTLLASAREHMLTLLVPAEYKDAHLEMVMVISQWMIGYQGQEEKVTAAALRWQALVDQYPWIE